MLIRRRVVVVIILLASFFCVFVTAMYLSVPQANTDLGKFDVVIVLGTPANSDGMPSPEQRERVLEGVREYRGGIAPHLIMTGGAAHNGWVEADVMDRLAESKGVAPEAIVKERQALNTIQNAYYSVKIMQEHGWRSAEVVSSPSHLPRASLIFSHFPIKWKMHSKLAGRVHVSSGVDLYPGSSVYDHAESTRLSFDALSTGGRWHGGFY